ncbi:hypothetical protein AAKU55_001575 [Oxalobacteraceae bacterium GrIS 1.11]
MSDFVFSVASINWNAGHSIRVYASNGKTVSEKCWDGGPWYTGALTAPGQAVGSASWVDSAGQVHIRTYVSNQNKITEYCWDKNEWNVGGFSSDGTTSSATAWYQNNSVHLRVYVTKANGQVQEQCWDGNGPWYVGAYTES